MSANILVVDDCNTVQLDLSHVFSAADLGVVVCNTRAAALKKLTHHPFSVVVLDVNLPDGDGIELVGELKQSARLSKIPVVLLSTDDEVLTRIRGMAGGAVEYIGKPYNRAYLVQRVIALSREADATTTKRVERPSSAHKVLVIDAGASYRDTLSRQLRSDGHRLVVARSGKEALEFLSADTFTYVIFDMEPSGPNGIELCKRIKASPGGSDAHILILTARDDAEARRVLNEAGADEFVFITPGFGLLRIRLRVLIRKLYRRNRDVMAAPFSAR